MSDLIATCGNGISRFLHSLYTIAQIKNMPHRSFFLKSLRTLSSQIRHIALMQKVEFRDILELTHLPRHISEQYRRIRQEECKI
jgi:hypothetical protein